MVCKHEKGDPRCGEGARESLRYEADQQRKRADALEQKLSSPDSERFEIAQALEVGQHLVLEVLYPNCSNCAYEGRKVMVFLCTKAIQALSWKRIDPHFRDPSKGLAKREAPSPAVRFPASPRGWNDAIAWAEWQESIARGKA